MTRHSLTDRKSRTSAVVLGVVALAVSAVIAAWFSHPRLAVSGAARPETGPMPRLADPPSLYASVEPAKNPTRICLQDDGRKVVGWVAGAEDFTDGRVRVYIDGKLETRLAIDKNNTFTWEYQLEKPTQVTFKIAKTWGVDLDHTLTVAPAAAEKEPNVFFVVDRTAYRPTQALHFAGFLRKLNAAGDFEPIANTEVDVELVSQAKQTKAFKMRLRSDDHGKIAGDYVFSDADALDTYSLQVPGYKGSARLLLGEYRKSKIKLKIAGDVKDEKLDLKFETVDFLDKPVPASKLSFTIQVVEKSKADRPRSLKAEEFAYYTPAGALAFDLDDLPEEDRLLWLADNIPPRNFSGQSSAVAQYQGDLALHGTEPGKYAIDLKKEWKLGNFSVHVQGVVTDANGREQRATQVIALQCDKSIPQPKLEVAKELFVTGKRFSRGSRPRTASRLKAPPRWWS